jgi:hypothetical protein
VKEAMARDEHIAHVVRMIEERKDGVTERKADDITVLAGGVLEEIDAIAGEGPREPAGND